jgi:hypothetical protein
MIIISSIMYFNHQKFSSKKKTIKFYWLDCKRNPGPKKLGHCADVAVVVETGVAVLTFKTDNPTTTITTLDNIKRILSHNDDTVLMEHSYKAATAISWPLELLESTPGTCLFS